MFLRISPGTFVVMEETGPDQYKVLFTTRNEKMAKKKVKIYSKITNNPIIMEQTPKEIEVEA